MIIGRCVYIDLLHCLSSYEQLSPHQVVHPLNQPGLTPPLCPRLHISSRCSLEPRVSNHQTPLFPLLFPSPIPLVKILLCPQDVAPCSTLKDIYVCSFAAQLLQSMIVRINEEAVAGVPQTCALRSAPHAKTSIQQADLTY